MEKLNYAFCSGHVDALPVGDNTRRFFTVNGASPPPAIAQLQNLSYAMLHGISAMPVHCVPPVRDIALAARSVCAPGAALYPWKDMPT